MDLKQASWYWLCRVDPAPVVAFLEDYDWPAGGADFGEHATYPDGEDLPPELAEAAGAIFQEVLAQFPAGARRGRTHLSLIRPGRAVPHHKDGHNPHLCACVHVPLLTNPQVHFMVDQSRAVMDVGHAYVMDPGRFHSIANDGETDRVHLFFIVL